MLRELARQGVWMGTSSWTYADWIGQVYVGDYSGARSKFTKARFIKESLKEFSINFPSVCFDGAYYNYPTVDQLTRYYEMTPPDFRFTLKATQYITVRRSRSGMGMQPGQLNNDYLNCGLFEEKYFKPVFEGLKDKLGVILFEFSPFNFDQSSTYKPLDFVKDLHKFLLHKPSGVKFAVEVRDPEFFDPAFTRYFDCLHYHAVAHVINQHTWVPSLIEQLQLPGILPAEFTVVRTILRNGVTHSAGEKKYLPFVKTQDPYPEIREAVANLINESIADKRELYLYANNVLEGNAPNTLAAYAELALGKANS